MSNFPCSLTRNITSHSMENFVFHSLLRWKMIIKPILNTSLIHLSLGRLGECSFWTWEWKGQTSLGKTVLSADGNVLACHLDMNRYDSFYSHTYLIYSTWMYMYIPGPAVKAATPSMCDNLETASVIANTAVTCKHVQNTVILTSLPR